MHEFTYSYAGWKPAYLTENHWKYTEKPVKIQSLIGYRIDITCQINDSRVMWPVDNQMLTFGWPRPMYDLQITWR